MNEMNAWKREGADCIRFELEKIAVDPQPGDRISNKHCVIIVHFVKDGEVYAMRRDTAKGFRTAHRITLEDWQKAILG